MHKTRWLHYHLGHKRLKARRLRAASASARDLLVTQRNKRVLILGYQMGAKAKEDIVEQRMAFPNVYEERRRSQRLRLQIPLFVRGRDAQRDQFMELAKTLDISALGAFLTCPRPLILNDVITLTIPAPSITSSALVPAGMPPIQARVKRQHEAGDVHLVGVEFLKPIG